MSAKLKILLVDDEDLVREGIACWFEQLDDIEIVGQAGSFEQATQVFSSCSPDLVFVDLHMPGKSGIALVQHLRQIRPGIKCVMLSSALEPNLVFDAFQAGAIGYLPKLVTPEELTLAIQTFQKDLWYLSPVVTKQVIEFASRSERSEPSAELALSDLEREFLRLSAEGFSFQELCQELKISSSTGQRLKKSLSEKVKGDSLLDFIRAAVRLGIVKI